MTGPGPGRLGWGMAWVETGVVGRGHDLCTNHTLRVPFGVKLLRRRKLSARKAPNFPLSAPNQATIGLLWLVAFLG